MNVQAGVAGPGAQDEGAFLDGLRSDRGASVEADAVAVKSTHASRTVEEYRVRFKEWTSAD